MTPLEIFKKIKKTLAEHPEKVAGLTATYDFTVTNTGGDDFTFHLQFEDGKPPVAEQGLLGDAKVAYTVAAEFAEAALAKTSKDAQMMFMTGKLKMKGDMGLAMKLVKIMD